MSCKVCSAMGRTYSICNSAPVVMRAADGVDVTGYQVEIENQRTRIAVLEGLVGELVNWTDTLMEYMPRHPDDDGAERVINDLIARARAALNGGGGK